jgi:hypothetical protein
MGDGQVEHRIPEKLEPFVVVSRKAAVGQRKLKQPREWMLVATRRAHPRSKHAGGSWPVRTAKRAAGQRMLPPARVAARCAAWRSLLGLTFDTSATGRPVRTDVFPGRTQTTRPPCRRPSSCRDPCPLTDLKSSMAWARSKMARTPARWCLPWPCWPPCDGLVFNQRRDDLSDDDADTGQHDGNEHQPDERDAALLRVPVWTDLFSYPLPLEQNPVCLLECADATQIAEVHPDEERPADDVLVGDNPQKRESRELSRLSPIMK